MTGSLRKITGAQEAKTGAREATRASVAGQEKALEYLKETEELPQQFREEALTELAGMFGAGGTFGTPQEQAAMFKRAKLSPLYSAMLRSGDESALRTSSATGGLRGGQAIQSTQEAQDRALMAAYNQQQQLQSQRIQGLQGLANLPTNAPQIAGAMQGIGNTQAQGIQAAAGAARMGFQDLLGVAQTGASIYGAI